jgi:hypothetical protein
MIRKSVSSRGRREDHRYVAWLDDADTRRS